MDDDEATEGPDRVAGLFVRALLGGLVALWGLLEASQRHGPTERLFDAVRAALRTVEDER